MRCRKTDRPDADYPETIGFGSLAELNRRLDAYLEKRGMRRSPDSFVRRNPQARQQAQRTAKLAAFRVRKTGLWDQI